MRASARYTPRTLMKAHLDKNKYNGVYSFDLLIAILIVLLMFYFSLVVITKFRDEIQFTFSEFNGKEKAFLISEKLVSRDLSLSDIQTYQNLVLPHKLPILNTTKYIQDFGLDSINITLRYAGTITSISEAISTSSNIYCYNRIVLVKFEATESPGIVRVCITNRRL
jgi:hypothetical protein